MSDCEQLKFSHYSQLRHLNPGSVSPQQVPNNNNMYMAAYAAAISVCEWLICGHHARLYSGDYF